LKRDALRTFMIPEKHLERRPHLSSLLFRSISHGPHDRPNTGHEAGGFRRFPGSGKEQERVVWRQRNVLKACGFQKTAHASRIAP
jgi:hypothetical protein